MALRTIRKDDDPCLYKTCRPVEKFDEKLRVLIEDLFDTMYDADGVGLAAPQVGILRRAAVIDTGEIKMELINPEIVERSGLYGALEGCLSFPGKSGYVERSEHVVVRGYDRNGRMQEFSVDRLAARAVQHELDHLDGRVYLALVTEPPEGFDPEADEEEEA
ncbi:MAG: peptide deformylase [Clostridia bacterium]|nr:peptide deformylase [Clostridia bacterium]